MSEPKVAMAVCAATAAADPPDDPPGERDRSCGLLVIFMDELAVVEPMANSSMFILPSGMAPAAFSLVMTVASYGEVYESARICDAHVQGCPIVLMLSFMPMGIPPRGRDRSAEAAAFLAWSKS